MSLTCDPVATVEALNSDLEPIKYHFMPLCSVIVIVLYTSSGVIPAAVMMITKRIGKIEELGLMYANGFNVHIVSY